MKKNQIYIIEMLNLPVNKKWKPTIGIALTRDEGRVVLSQWKRRNPDDKFRLVPYIPKEKL